MLLLAVCYHWLCATIGYVLLLAMCYYWLCAGPLGEATTRARRKEEAAGEGIVVLSACSGQFLCGRRYSCAYHMQWSVLVREKV